MAGEGQMLRTAREEKGWSLLETEEKTKIRVRYIQALEDEEYSVLPGTTYVKGYLRTYSKQLGLNSDDIINSYKSSSEPEEEVVSVIENTDRNLKPHNKLSWLRPVIISGIALVLIVTVVGIKGFYQPEGMTADSNYTPQPLISAPNSEPLPPSSDETQPSTPSSPPNVIASTQEGLTAQLVFTQACWIEIKVDDQAPFQGTFAAGTSKEIKGSDKIELVSVGNAGGCTVTLNGKTLPNLGKQGEVLRNMILTKDTINQL